MDKKTIGLFGISNVSNFGCEAIVRSTCTMLKQIQPNYEIIYYTRNYKTDIVYLSDLDIKITQISRTPDLISRVINKGLSMIGIHYRIPFDDYCRICRETDMVISIGGDIYTIPEVDRNNKRYICNNRMVQFGEYAKRKGIKIVIYGASIGPFGNVSRNRLYFLNHLQKVDLIVCRERLTTEYLHENGISDNVIFSPDPAFYVTDETVEITAERKENIVVNFSGRLIQKGKTSSTSQKKQLANLLLKIVEETGEDILLLPHVLSSDPSDDDLVFMKDVYSLLSNEDKTHIQLIDDCRGFLQAKQILRRSKMVIAARMHCAINAISEAVPTILLSYSEKSAGMTQYIYDTDKWVIGVADIQSQLPKLVGEMYADRIELSKQLQSRIAQIRNNDERETLLWEMRRLLND